MKYECTTRRLYSAYNIYLNNVLRKKKQYSQSNKKYRNTKERITYYFLSIIKELFGKVKSQQIVFMKRQNVLPLNIDHLQVVQCKNRRAQYNCII